MEIDEIFNMLNENNDFETQKKGIYMASKIKHLSIFIMPNESKMLWRNCAKVLATKSDEELKLYFFSIMEWLKDPNWPGHDIIFNRLLHTKNNILITPYQCCIYCAKKNDNELWLYYLTGLSENKSLYSLLYDECKEYLQPYLKFWEITT